MIDKIKIQRELAMRGYSDVDLKDGSFCIEPRPSYCDRGSYSVKVLVNPGQHELYIDGADMFPRYYFVFENMISELNSWISKNGQGTDETDKKS